MCSDMDERAKTDGKGTAVALIGREMRNALTSVQVLYKPGVAHLVSSGQMLELGLRIWISRILVWVDLLDLTAFTTGDRRKFAIEKVHCHSDIAA